MLQAPWEISALVPWSISLFLPYFPFLALSLDTQTHPLPIFLHPTSTMLTNFFCCCCSVYSIAPSPLITLLSGEKKQSSSLTQRLTHTLWLRNHKLLTQTPYKCTFIYGFGFMFSVLAFSCPSKLSIWECKLLAQKALVSRLWVPSSTMPCIHRSINIADYDLYKKNKLFCPWSEIMTETSCQNH